MEFSRQEYWSGLPFPSPGDLPHSGIEPGFPALLSGSLIAQLVKNPPAVQETLVQFLGWEDPLEKGCLPTPAFWPGESHRLYSPWGRKELDTTEWFALSLLFITFTSCIAGKLFTVWATREATTLLKLNYFLRTLLASLVAQLVKNLPAMQEIWVWFLGWEDHLEKEIVTHSSILAWRIPWTEEPGRLQFMGSQELDMT